MPTKRKTLLERAKAKELRQAKRIERSYTRERKIEVLMYLLNHRVPDVRARRFPRRRIGQPHEGESSQQLIVQEDHGDHIWYRAPTYSEASEFWNIPTPTIQGWWDARKKLLEGTGVELPELATTGASPVLNDGTTQPTSGATDRAQGTVPGENVGGQSGRAPAENGAAPTMSGPVPPPNPRQNGAPSANGTSLPDGDGILAPNTSEARTSAAQPAPTGSEQHPAAPAAQRPSANVARPAPRSAALGPPVPTNPPPNVMIETGRPQAPAVQTSPAPAVRGPQPTPTANAAPSQTTTAPGPPPPAAHRQPPPAPHGSQAVQIEPSASATPNQPPGVARAENHVLNTAPESAPAAPGASATSPAQAQQQQQQQQQQQHQHQQHQEPEGGRTDASAPEDQGLAPSSPNMDIDTDDVPSGEEAADGAGGSSGTDDGERDSLFESATSTPAL
ncbi:uncharacterized protein B0H64DRAFT_454502 [Chaetomium fimeti]|uniref:Uncharacterized protein n=1 Tax=Chaetomium fimeti TaxID=1854472 RepID=A0AAE0LVA9_9PEZI|nr:hypothetical protein B0H64DRAFT_454502 [Chaetomium fimeti]